MKSHYFIIYTLCLQSALSLKTNRNRSIQRTVTSHHFWPFDRSTEPSGVPIIDAVETRNEEAIKLIVSKRESSMINERNPDGENALHIIAKKGHYKYPPAGIPKLLVDAGIDLNAKNKNNETALEISLLSGWQKIAMLLLDNGADSSVVTDRIKSRITCPDCKRVVKQYNL